MVSSHSDLYVIQSPEVFQLEYLQKIYNNFLSSSPNTIHTLSGVSPITIGPEGVIHASDYSRHYGFLPNDIRNQGLILRLTTAGVLYYGETISMNTTNLHFSDAPHIHSKVFVNNVIVIFPGGYIYDGTFYNGLPNFYGRLIYPSGNHYMGQWRNGSPEGNGIYTYVGHDIWQSYSGWWRVGKRHGGGRLIFLDGSVELKEYSEGIEIQTVSPETAIREYGSIQEWINHFQPRDTLLVDIEIPDIPTIPSPSQSSSSLSSHSPSSLSSPPPPSPPPNLPPLPQSTSPQPTGSQPTESQSPTPPTPPTPPTHTPRIRLPPIQPRPLSYTRSAETTHAEEKTDTSPDSPPDSSPESSPSSPITESPRTSVSNISSIDSLEITTQSSLEYGSNLTPQQKLDEKRALLCYYRHRNSLLLDKIKNYRERGQIEKDRLQEALLQQRQLQRQYRSLEHEIQILNSDISDYQRTIRTLGTTIRESIQVIRDKNREIDRLHAAMSPSVSTTNTNTNPPSNPAESSLCKICLTNPRSIVLLPCKHFVLCQPCERQNRTSHTSSDTRESLCPICRTPYNDFLRVFT